MNPAINKQVVLARASKKIERGTERMGFLPATGTQAILRCRGLVFFNPQTRVYVVITKPAPKKEYVN